MSKQNNEMHRTPFQRASDVLAQASEELHKIAAEASDPYVGHTAVALDLLRIKAPAAVIHALSFEWLVALREVTDAIEAYCDDHNSGHPTDVTVCLPQLRAAIAKAEGGEK